MALLSKAKRKGQGKISDVAFPNIITIHTILKQMYRARKRSFDLNGHVNLKNSKFHFVISVFHKRPSIKYEPKARVCYVVGRDGIV